MCTCILFTRPHKVIVQLSVLYMMSPSLDYVSLFAITTIADHLYGNSVITYF